MILRHFCCGFCSRFPYLLRSCPIHFLKNPHEDLVIRKAVLYHQLRNAFIRFQELFVKIHGAHRIYVCQKCLSRIFLKQAAEILPA